MIGDFDCDLNKEDPFEQKVLKALKAADVDGSGTLTTSEFVTVMRGVALTEKANQRLGRMVAGLAAIVLLLIVALVGTSTMGAIVGGESIKESRVPDCSNGSSDTLCQSGKVVRVDSVESFVPSFFDLPSVPTEQLAYMRDVTMYIDMSSNAAIGGPVEATLKVSGAYKRSQTQVHLVTTSGYTISIDSVAKAGTITMDGAMYPVSDTQPSAGRKLETDNTPMVRTISAKQLVEHHKNRRKLFFAGALKTTGSFYMTTTAGIGDRRELKETFEDFQTNSGAFIMMAV